MRRPRHNRETRLYGQELLSIAAALWCGLSLLMTPDRFGTSHAFDAMANLEPEWRWAILFLLGGTFQFVALMWGRPWARRVAIAGAAGTWAFVTVMLWLGDHWAWGVGIFGALTILQTRRAWLESRDDDAA